MTHRRPQVVSDESSIYVFWFDESTRGAPAMYSGGLHYRHSNDPSPTDLSAWSPTAQVTPPDLATIRVAPLIQDGVLLVTYLKARLAPPPGWNLRFREGHALPDTATMDMDWNGVIALDGDFTILADVAVTIAPGTYVEVAATDRLQSGEDTNSVEIIVEDGAKLVAGQDSASTVVFATALTDTLFEPGDEWYGIRLQAMASAQTGYGFLACKPSQSCAPTDFCSDCDNEKSEFKNVLISDGEVGLEIEGNVAPVIDGVAFENIVDEKDIYLSTRDVVVPVDFEWNLEAPTHVVAKNVTGFPDSTYDYQWGTTDRIDLIVEGTLTTSSSSPGSTYVEFHPETKASTGDGWGGVALISSGAPRLIQHADIGFAKETALFVRWPDSTFTLRNSRIHDFADIGLWIQNDWGPVVVDSVSFFRGDGLADGLGRVAAFLDGTDEVTLSNSTVRLETNNFGGPGLLSRCVEVFFGKTMCNVPGGGGTTALTLNAISGPGDSVTTPGVSGVYANWVCGGGGRTVQITDNVVSGFNLAALEFSQSSDIQVECNKVEDNARAVEHQRDGEPTGAGVRFRENYLGIRAGYEGLVRTDNALKTKLGPFGTKGDNELQTTDIGGTLRVNPILS